MRKVLGPGQPNWVREVQWVVTKLGLLPIVGLIAFFLLAASACDKPTRTARHAAGEATLKVMSFNVNFGGPDTTSIAAIANADADLVLLQETTSDWEQEIRKNLSKRYPHMAFRHCCGAGGLAILSKDMIDKGSYFKAKEIAGSWFPAWRHVVQTPLGRVQVLNLHLRPQISRGGSVIRGYFTTPTVRRKEIDAHFEQLDDSIPTIIAGDFNENKNGKAIVFLRKRGLRSALPEFSPSADTWRWKTSIGSVHSQLDHITYDPRLEPINALVLKEGRSDHWPVVATFVRSKLP